MGAGYVLVVMEWVLATRRQVYLCLDACRIVQHGSRLGLPMSIYLLHSYLLQALMRISPHKCLPSRVGQASISFVNHCGEQRVLRQSCGYGLLCFDYVSMDSFTLEHGTAL